MAHHPARILQDDGAKTCLEISPDSPFNKSRIRMKEDGKKAGDLAHHPARNSAG